MRKVLFILVAVLFLAACGEKEIEIHESVYNDLATDSLQVLEILEEKSDEQEELSESDRNILDTYIEKYGRQYENHLLEGINSTIYVATELEIEFLSDKTILASSQGSVDTTKENVLYYIENGDRE